MDADEREHTHGEDDERKLREMGDRMERLVGDSGDEFGRRPAVTFSAGCYLVLAGDGRSRVLVALDIVGTVAVHAGRRAGVTDLEFSSVEALKIAFHDERREPVFFGQMFLFMTRPAGLDDIEM